MPTRTVLAVVAGAAAAALVVSAAGGGGAARARWRVADLAPFALSDIDARGRIVGTVETPQGDSRAVLWQHGRLTRLGTLGGALSTGAAINEHGQIVGDGVTAAGKWRVFLWQNGKMTDIVGDRRPCSELVGLNERGQVAGRWHTVIWTRESVR